MNQTITFDKDIKVDCIGIEKHFTSLNFNASEGNKILSVVFPVLSLAIKLHKLQSLLDATKLRKVLAYQVNAVCDSLKRISYSDETIKATQYALCCFVDESIATTEWGQSLGWEKDGLLKQLTGESGDGKKFFMLVKEFYSDPHRNVDVLEFFYFCLSLGFAGKYRQHKKGQAVIKEIMDELYECVLRYRRPKENSDSLVINPRGEFNDVISSAENVSTAKKFFNARMLWLGGLILVLGFFMYENFNIRLNSMLKPIYKTAVSFNIGAAQQAQ